VVDEKEHAWAKRHIEEDRETAIDGNVYVELPEASNARDL